VIRNPRAFAVFEKYGGRCVCAVAWDPRTHDGRVIVGAPFTNPSSPGEEELTGSTANVCAAFKEMNGGGYADTPYTAQSLGAGWRFTSPDGKVRKDVTLPNGAWRLHAAYTETVSGPLYVRFGLSPNPRDLAFHGRAHLVSQSGTWPCGPLPCIGSAWHSLINTAGGAARVTAPQIVANPADAGSDRRNLGLIETVEISGDGTFEVELELLPTGPNQTDVTPSPVAAFAITGPSPSPARGVATLALTLPAAAHAQWALLDVSGRRVAAGDLGLRTAGEVRWTIESRDAAGKRLAPGLYFVDVRAGAERVQRRWIVLE
jgi:hypothetical protein